MFIYLINCILNNVITHKCINNKFKFISCNRIIRYVKLILTLRVILLIAISSIISNTIFLFREYQYQHLYPEDNIKIEGIIISDKEEREYKNRYKVKVQKINQVNKQVSTQIYIDIRKNIEFEYGDKIILEGVFRKGSKQRNTGGFDYQLYLKAINVYGILDVEKSQKISANHVGILEKSTHMIKIQIAKNIEKILGREEAQIVKGLLLGDNTGLDETLKEEFQIANISHVLAVSGMHTVYIMIGLEFVFKKWLGKRKVKYIMIVGVFFYMSITGFTSSIVRAGIMGIINISAFLFYRKNDIWTAIAVSLGIILIQNPYAIMGIGLQLSYLGTIGIILFHKKVKQYLDNLKIRDNINHSTMVENLKDIVSVTISAQIMILPVMLYHFHIFGIYFLITNILVSYIIGPIMFLSIIFLISSFINLEIAKIVSIFLTLGIKLLTQIANLANLPFSKLYVPTPNFVFIMIYYIGILVGNQVYTIYTVSFLNNTQKRVRNSIALVKYRVYRKIENFKKSCNKKTFTEKNIKKQFLIISTILIIIIFGIKIPFFSENLEIHFLDVGQGDSTFIITPNHKTILIDGGGSTSKTFDVGKDTILPYLLNKGFTKIDYIFISHFDYDHVGGILTILEEINVKQIYISKQVERSENYERFLELVEQKKLNVQVVTAGDEIQIEKIHFHILWPIKEPIEENKLNNNAIVMKLQYKDFSMLFTGDIEEIAEKKILQLYKNKPDKLSATILKIAHHGSNSSSIEEFLKTVNSKIAIIGVGENNMFGHPNLQVLRRLEDHKMQIFRTDRNGEITIKTNGTKMQIKKFLN